MAFPRRHVQAVVLFQPLSRVESRTQPPGPRRGALLQEADGVGQASAPGMLGETASRPKAEALVRAARPPWAILSRVDPPPAGRALPTWARGWYLRLGGHRVSCRGV